MQCHQCFLFDCDVIYVVLFVKVLSRLEVMLLSLNQALVQNHPDSKILTRLLTFLSCKKVYRQIYFIKKHYIFDILFTMFIALDNDAAKPTTNLINLKFCQNL